MGKATRYFTSVLAAFLIAIQFLSAQTSPNYKINAKAEQIAENCFRLTTASTYYRGSVWMTSKISLDSSFVVKATIFLGCKPHGADGLAFVLHNDPAGLSAIGGLGGGMGFGIRLPEPIIAPSLAVEFDTWDNRHNGYTDIPEDHIAIYVDGKQFAPPLAGPVMAKPNGSNIDDCNEYAFEFRWNAPNKNMKVFFDCREIFDLDFDMVANVFSGVKEVYMGFTAATGITNNEHRVCFDLLEFGTVPIEQITGCPGETVQLTAGNYPNIEWYPNPALSCTQCPNPTVVVNPEDRIFRYWFMDDCGTVRNGEVEIIMDDCTECPTPIFPNAFTPNGDGLNDEFGLLNANEANLYAVLCVYNRWGQMVFETFDLSKGWDGNYNGIAQGAGVYAWVLRGTCNGKDVLESGNVTLLR